MDVPNAGVDLFKRQHIWRAECIALFCFKQRLYLRETVPLFIDQSPRSVDDSNNNRPGLCEVEGCSGSDIAPSLHHHALALQLTTINPVVMADRFRYTVTCDQIGHPEFSIGIGRESHVLHNLGHTLTELADALDLFRILRIEMAVKNAFLWMPNAAVLCDRNDLVDFIHVHVSAGSVI